VFTALIPDFDHFKGSEGGRTLPLLHPDGSANVAPGLVRALGALLDVDVSPRDVLAYVAAIAAHRAYTSTFLAELTTPGVRVPITADPSLWRRSVAIGEEVLFLHTYGQSYSGIDRPHGDVRMPAGDPRRPRNMTPIAGLPTTMNYTEHDRVLHVGEGAFSPVEPAVWDYTVGGKNVLKSWFNYRKSDPGGKKTSPLDNIHASSWDPAWTTELVELLTVLTRLVDLEPQQADLLERVVTGPILTMDALTTAGVRWPRTAADRKPRKGFGPRNDDTLI
jgi:hypothetical protein